MASSPTISASLVPHQQTGGPKSNIDVIGLLSYFFYVILGIVFVMAIGVFLYSRILISLKNSKEAALAKESQALATQQVQAAGFSRLKERIDSASTLIGSHVALSGFFPILEEILPANVRFTSLQLSLNDRTTPLLMADGVAKNYNALALASAAFSKNDHFKNTLLKITKTSPDGSVDFSVTSTLDQNVVTFTP